MELVAASISGKAISFLVFALSFSMRSPSCLRSSSSCWISVRSSVEGREREAEEVSNFLWVYYGNGVVRWNGAMVMVRRQWGNCNELEMKRIVLQPFSLLGSFAAPPPPPHTHILEFHLKPLVPRD